MNNSANDANGPIRETNDVLSRLVISQPEVDLDRERERMAEAVPRAYTGEASSPIAAPNAVDNDGNDDGRAGERRRQDHSTKREKTTKFGEYFLGNTLGEGEFGKVKMGWKQEGGVQVGFEMMLGRDCKLIYHRLLLN
jgi:protein-serine/threonine kinase